MEHRRVRALVSVDGRYVGAAPEFDEPVPWWSEVEGVTAHLDSLLGVPTAVLRMLTASQTSLGRGGHVVYHVEAAARPRAGVLDPSPWPGWEAIVRPHPLRSSWAEVGGPRRLVDWAARTAPLTGPPVQVKTWNLSCLYRLPTSSGPVWAKATSRFASVDADIIRHVRAHDATLAPAVLAVDLDNRWSLLEHAPGVDCWEASDATVETVLRRWVAVQASLASLASTSRVDAIDAPSTPPSSLAAALDGLLDVVAPKLTSADRSGIAELVDAVPALVSRLESAGLPHTVVHGDFHPGNWRSDGRSYAIVDWADAYLGHPAADIERLREWLPVERQELGEKAWIDAWRTVLPGSNPAAALAPMSVLVKVILGLLYQRFLDNIEPDERIYHENDPLTMLRAAITTLRSLDL